MKGFTDNNQAMANCAGDIPRSAPHSLTRLSIAMLFSMASGVKYGTDAKRDGSLKRLYSLNLFLVLEAD